MNQVKSKINELIKNEECSTKILQNYDYLKHMKHINMLSRGNFINRNVSELKKNIKNDDWLDNLISKFDSKVQHIEVVKERSSQR